MAQGGRLIHRITVLLTILTWLVSMSGPPSAAQTTPSSGTITYIYDQAGRVVGVVDPDNETAVYTYDAVGNLLSISRYNSALASVIEFAPHSGAVGSMVTIYGTGFSTTATENTVAFNGTPATVTSATATEIVTRVPAGATTGTIRVTTPAGSATSATPFVVGASAAPAITGFMPTIGTFDAAVSITGTNFEATAANDNVFFNLARGAITSATATNILSNVPSVATSGRISVVTPAGRAVSSQDFFVVPTPLTAADVVFTGRMAIGDTRSITITGNNKIAMLLFDGLQGQRVSLVQSGLNCFNARTRILSPDGSTLAEGCGGYFIGTQTLPATGTYTIVITLTSGGSGSTTLTLYDVPPDVTGTITPGGPAVEVRITVPGQKARLTFTGAAGQRISLNQSGSNCFSSSTTILKPDGSTLTSGCGGYFIDTQTLPVAGTYTIFIDPKDANTGSTTLTLYNVPPDVTGTITPGGPAVMVTITVPGQKARLTFAGAAGQRISLNQSGFNCFSSSTTILKPDGSRLVSTCGGIFVDTQTLSAAGTYTILIEPKDANTGSTTLTLYDVPPDSTGTITIGGPPVTVTIMVPGQSARLTFSGTAGQHVRLTQSGFNCFSAFTTILRPDGSTLVSTCGGIPIDVTLPVSGTYTIIINPRGAATGSTTLALSLL